MDEENYYAQLKRLEDNLFTFVISSRGYGKKHFEEELNKRMKEKAVKIFERLEDERRNQK